MGLIGAQSFGSGFTSLNFNVVENGVTIVPTQTFTTLAAANSYFTNHALNLGAFTSGPGQVLDFNFDVATNAPNSGFGAEFLLGSTSGDQPPGRHGPRGTNGAAGITDADRRDQCR